LYECLTSKRAFAADSVMGTLAKILFEEPPAVREVRPDVPAGVDELLRCMLAKERDGRPPHAAAVVAAAGALRASDHPAANEERPPAAALTAREQRLLC